MRLIPALVALAAPLALVSVPDAHGAACPDVELIFARECCGKKSQLQQILNAKLQPQVVPSMELQVMVHFPLSSDQRINPLCLGYFLLVVQRTLVAACHSWAWVPN